MVKRVRDSKSFWPLVALGLIALLDAVFAPGFFKIGLQEGHLYGNVIDVLNDGAPLMLVAIGMTFVIATGGVDLSVGAVIAISAAMGAVLINPALGNQLISNDILTRDATNTALPVIVIADLAAGTLCGLWNGFLVSRGRIQPMVATLILMVAGRGIAQLITNGQIMTIYYTPFFWFGNGFIFGLPVSIYIVAFVFLIAWVGARKTSIGMFIESVGVNAKSSYYTGINEQNVKLLAYGFCGFCGAIAGLILSSYVHSADANNIGLYYELDAILAVVLGGTLMSGGRFSIFASIVGAVVIWTFTITVYTLGVPANALLAAKAILVLLVILLYSDYTQRLLQRFERKDSYVAQEIRLSRQPVSPQLADIRSRVAPFLVRHGPLLTTIAVFILIYVIGGQLYPAMQKPQVFFNLFINDASLLLVSIGMTFVILTGGIDLSVGGMVALTSTASAALLKAGVSPYIVMPLMIGLGVGFGVTMGSLIHFLKVQPFIATLMGLFFARGVAYLISLTSITITDPVYKSLALTSLPLPFLANVYVYIPTLVGPVVLIVAIYLLVWTRLGRTLYALGNNEQSALLMGLPVARTKITAYALSGFCSALAGIVTSISLLAGYGQFATGMELDAIASVVIGGTLLTGGVGNVVGTLFGVLINATIVSILQFNGTLTSWWTRIGVGVLTLIFIGVQSLFYVRRRQA